MQTWKKTSKTFHKYELWEKKKIIRKKKEKEKAGTYCRLGIKRATRAGSSYYGSNVTGAVWILSCRLSKFWKPVVDVIYIKIYILWYQDEMRKWHGLKYRRMGCVSMWRAWGYRKLLAWCFIYFYWKFHEWGRRCA